MTSGYLLPAHTCKVHHCSTSRLPILKLASIAKLHLMLSANDLAFLFKLQTWKGLATIVLVVTVVILVVLGLQGANTA